MHAQTVSIYFQKMCDCNAHLDGDDRLLVIVIEADAQVLHLPQLIIDAIKEVVLLRVLHLSKQRRATALGKGAESNVSTEHGDEQNETEAGASRTGGGE